MFQSSGYFKGVACPFHKHDLCHRPYCHFKHVKSRNNKEKVKETVENNNTDPVDTNLEKKQPNLEKKQPNLEKKQTNLEKKQESPSRSPSPIEGVSEDILDIVKNISPSKLIEFAKRKQEVQELQQTLDQVDRESKVLITPLNVPESITNIPAEKFANACRSPEEIKMGLIDRLYSKAKVDVNITSGDIVNKPKTISKAREEKGIRKGRIVCNCDDPDCSGFQEESEDHVFTHINVNQIEDEYMRRKMQRRLDRRKKALTQGETSSFGTPQTKEKRSGVIIREADFFIPPVQSTEPGHGPVNNGLDDDLSKYIDKCKEEYAKKRKEKVSFGKVVLNETQSNTLNIEQRVVPEVKEHTSSSEKKENKVMNNKSTVEKKKNIDATRPVSKKVLSDVDFFSSNVAESNMNDEDECGDDGEGTKNVKAQESVAESGKATSTGTLAKKKSLNSTSTTEENSTINKSSEKKVEIKKKRVFFPSEVPEKTKTVEKPKTVEKVDKNQVEVNNTDKKIKANNTQIDKPDDKTNKKVKTNISTQLDNDKLDTGKSNKKLKTVNSGKCDGDKIGGKCEQKKKEDHPKTDNKVEKDNSEKKVKLNPSTKSDNSVEKSSSVKKTKSSFEDTCKSDDREVDIQDSNIAVQAKVSTDNHSLVGESGKKRLHTDSESSNTSRNAFDVITVSSSDDDMNTTGSSPGEPIDSNEEVFDPEEFKSSDRRTSCSDKEDSDLMPGVSGSANKRMALTNEVIHRKPVQPHKPKSLKMSYVSPSLKPSEESKSITPKATVTEPIHEEKPGKKRISHIKPVVQQEKKEDERPKLEVDIGHKVPHLLRQKYFDKIIDELIPKCRTKKEAFGKGIAEEADAYKRCNRKQIYINLCANIVKRVRNMPNYVGPKEQPKADPMKTAQPTTKTINKAELLSGSNKKTKIDFAKTNVLVSRIQSVSTAGYQKIDPKSLIPKNCIKPASSKLVNATAEQRVVSGKRERQNSITLEALELTEDNFYDHMQQYLLTKEQMWENRYPKRDPVNNSITLIKDYVPSSNTLKRVCCRCGKEYFMNKKGKYVTRNECNYHWGKLLRQRGRNSGMAYTCCGVDAAGSSCAMCRLHVCHRVGPLENYASTELCENKDSKRKVLALDCEMCYTTQGLELTRLTVIDFDLEQIIDLFVKPDNPIVDYNTRFSGVTRDDLAEVTTTISDIHDILLNMIDKDTILLGHSLESDLNALNLIHDKVVDTSIVFPHRMGLPFKRALRNLMVEYLQKVIQSGEGGHDSCEDARSCMELMKYKFKEDQKSRKRVKTN